MEYKTRKFDANFFEEHREPLTLYQAAKDAFKKYDGTDSYNQGTGCRISKVG